MELKGLEHMADEVFAYDDLKEDFAYGHIPPEKRQYYIAQGLAAGRAAAVQYEGCDLAALLAADGVTLCRVTAPSRIGLHAQICYTGDKKQIDLCAATAKELSEVMADTPYPVSQTQVEQLFLAHEFYHWLEYSAGVATDEKVEPARFRLFGLFERKMAVRRTGEIAAFAFAKQWCKLPVHPKAMDYLLLCQKQGKTQAQAEEQFHRMEQEYQAACVTVLQTEKGEQR